MECGHIVVVGKTIYPWLDGIVSRQFAWVSTGFKQNHSAAGLRQSCGNGAAARPGSDDNEFAIGHSIFSSGHEWVPVIGRWSDTLPTHLSRGL